MAKCKITKTKNAHLVGGDVPNPNVRFKWVIEIEVNETWVADGFDMATEVGDERPGEGAVIDMLQQRLPYARSDELGGRIIAAPDSQLIRKAQGYRE